MNHNSDHNYAKHNIVSPINTLELNFPGTRSVADVKKDLYSMTDVSSETMSTLTGIPYDHNSVLNTFAETATSTVIQVPVEENRPEEKVVEQTSNTSTPEVSNTDYAINDEPPTVSINSSEVELCTEHYSADDKFSFETPDKTIKYDCAMDSICPHNTP